MRVLITTSVLTGVKASIFLSMLLVNSSFSACISPSGIDESNSGISTKQIQSLLNGETLGTPLLYLFLPLVDVLISAIVTKFETPIQFRTVMYQGNTCYNTAAMYHPSALDIWGRGDKRICTNKFPSQVEKRAHEEVAIAYTFAYSAIQLIPSLNDIVTNLMDNVLKLPMSNLFDNPEISTPWGLAKANVDDMIEYAKSDGWNSNGSLSHNFNQMPFSDFDYKDYSSYLYKVNPSSSSSIMRNQHYNEESKCVKKWQWEPLLETDGNGYFTKQEHVTPFAGFTGRLYGMTVSEYESFTIPKPNYDYCKEADFVLSETRRMSTDDMKKVELEVYDSKFTSLLPMEINWAIENGVSSFEFWFNDMTLVTAMYDATLLVWREKVAHNAVRPTTVVHALKGDEEIETYAGPFAGSKKVKGFDWQPYIRTMPHAEYPSGSSCICTAYAETLQLLTGSDETGTFPARMEFKAGASKIEPGVTPKNDVNIVYTKWSDIQKACSQSRLYGGMHFSKAVPAGEELCTGVASLITKRAELLKIGDVSGALADRDDTSITVKFSAITVKSGKKTKSKEKKSKSSKTKGTKRSKT